MNEVHETAKKLQSLIKNMDGVVPSDFPYRMTEVIGVADVLLKLVEKETPIKEGDKVVVTFEGTYLSGSRLKSMVRSTSDGIEWDYGIPFSWITRKSDYNG